MDVRELAALVSDMRQAQKEYFRTRDSSVLDSCRLLERKVDRVCEEALAQPSLFDSLEQD